MGVEVTYNGPKDKADPTNKFRVLGTGGRNDFVIRKGQTLPAHEAVVETLRREDVAEAHDFDFGADVEDSTVDFASSSARDKASELGLSEDDLEGEGTGADGAVKVEDVERVAEALEEVSA